jgi:Type I phosphodiesterase / nucleotide pyrophosphatase
MRLARVLLLLSGCTRATAPEDVDPPSLEGALVCPATDAGEVAPPAPPTTGKVVLVSIDGLRPDAIFAAPARRLQALACSGSFSWRAQTMAPTTTLPGHASMLSGYSPDQHRLLHDDLRAGYIAVPTVMGMVTAAGKRVVMVVGKDKLVQLAPPGTFAVYALVANGDDGVADRAIAEAASAFDLMFVHFPLVDTVGHAAGWMSPSYLRQVTATDAALERLLAVLGPEVSVIVTADHGGSGVIHWPGRRIDAQIPWIISGPRIHRGHPLGQPISTLDTAATAAWLLETSLRADAQGRPVAEALLP